MIRVLISLLYKNCLDFNNAYFCCWNQNIWGVCPTFGGPVPPWPQRRTAPVYVELNFFFQSRVKSFWYPFWYFTSTLLRVNVILANQSNLQVCMDMTLIGMSHLFVEEHCSTLNTKHCPLFKNNILTATHQH